MPRPEMLPPQQRPHPSKLFVEVTTRCNLRCAMCVKQAPGQGLVDGDMTAATFERLAPAFPFLEALVLNGIGEPTLHRGLEAFIGRVVKAVEPRTFGTLADRGILDTWNGTEWRTFRGEVTAYDFPFCYDCNLAMCDYVRDGDFEQDCHISRVPCAACLWCTGPFQCLR